MCHAGVPSRNQTDPPLLVVPDKRRIIALLCSRLVYVDVDGSDPAISDVCKDTGDLYYQVYTQDCDTGLGWVRYLESYCEKKHSRCLKSAVVQTPLHSRTSLACLKKTPQWRAKAACSKQILAYFRSKYSENATLEYEKLMKISAQQRQFLRQVYFSRH